MQSVYQLKRDPYSSHMQIVRFLASQTRPLKILDIGCSKGFIAQMAGNTHEFYGVDINPTDVQLAKKFYKKADVCDIERETPKYKNETFDVLIMADVLEHLRNPEDVLRRVIPLLKKDGTIIISIPNIAHLYVRLNLLAGNFNYQERGIMDKTHMRFFTLNSFRKLLRNTNLRITEEKTTPVPLPFLSPLFSKGSVLYPIYYLSLAPTLLLRRLFGFQFIFYCKKK